MDRAEIFEKLKEILSGAMENSTRLDALNEESDLRYDVGLNSVGLLYIVITIEETMNVSFDGVLFDDFHKVRDVIDYIEAHQ